jgi:hypothetical protein
MDHSVWLLSDYRQKSRESRGAVKLLFILDRRRACRRFTGKRGENIIPHRSAFCQAEIVEKIAQRSFLKFVHFVYCNSSGQGV